MPVPMKKDNSTKDQKALLRSKALHALSKFVTPIVLETHGGLGKLFAHCYSHIEQGVVIEKNPVKVQRLLLQRGATWAIYEGETEAALKAGIGNHLPVNFLDVDPYGDPWPIIDAFLTSKRILPEHLVIVVNDGLRQLVQRGGAWTTATLEDKVKKYGNSELNKRYLEVCRELMVERGVAKGYRMNGWTGYHCGRNGLMTHYAAMLQRPA